MKRYKLSNSDQKLVAHLIAHRKIKDVSSDDIDNVLERYLETYNLIVEKLKSYNDTATNL